MTRLATPPIQERRAPLMVQSEPEPKPNKLYVALQHVISAVYAALPPDRLPFVPLGRIAIIGAGVTGVSSAAHCVAHGFEVTIFERKAVTGGIWNDVNSTSSLQLNSLLYRFHPTLIWSGAFPKQAEILKQVRDLWERYGLQSRTRFNYDVKRVQRYTVSGKTAWSVNDGAEGVFDGLIVAIGTCAQPYERPWPERAQYQGSFHHSSELDYMKSRPHRVAVIGSGASAVEAAEQAIERGARQATIISRNDKWIIPRGLFAMGIIAIQPWGWSNRISRFCEAALKKFHYRDVAWLAPTPETGYGLDQSTPIVNDQFIQYVREGSANYLRGQVAGFVSQGIKVLPKGQSEPVVVQADVVIDATGFQRPSMGFLPSTLFPTGYEPPALFLTNFSVNDPTVVFTNSAYEEAIGTVGFLHIGIFSRILMMFLLEPELAPQPQNMRLWVDIVRYMKSDAPADAFGFFTYVEMLIYLLIFHLVQPRRMRWVLFNLYGFGGVGNFPGAGKTVKSLD